MESKGRRIGAWEYVGRTVTALSFLATLNAASAKLSSENPNIPKTPLFDKNKVKPIGFVLKWEVEHLPGRIKQIFSRDKQMSLEEEEEAISGYFNGNRNDKQKAQKAIDRRINETLRAEGFKIAIPADIEIEKPFNTAAIAPDDKIEISQWVVIRGGISQDEKNKVEDEVEKSSGNKSIIIFENGGAGYVYPSFVAEGGGKDFTQRTGIEETLHINSALDELGFEHGLDISNIRKNIEVYILAENVVNIATDEINEKVNKRYPGEKAVFVKSTKKDSATSSSYIMKIKNLKRNVNHLLREGRIKDSKILMEEERQRINREEGTNIRKINTAWLAVNAAYSDEFSPVLHDGENPLKNQESVWGMLVELRRLSSSLIEFWDTAMGITSFKELENVLAKKRRLIEKAS